MDPLDVQVVLLDIEGTVCPISFVKNVLFPYALHVLPSTLATQWDSPSFAPYRSAFPPKFRSTPEAFTAHVQDLMAQDLKIPYLKSLQGYLWLRGYESGEIRCPLFPDVQRAMRNWHDEGLQHVIYSSGSVAAQKLLFQYTDSEPEGDLRPLIAGYEDTVTAGMKGERESYVKIAERHGVETAKWLFLSDNVHEVRAARSAGMKSFIVMRKGNTVLSTEEREGQVVVESFEEVRIKGVKLLE